MLGGVFISYRREDSAGFAGRIYDRLTRRLGPQNIFMDVDSIRPGLDFVDVLSKKLSICDALIALIGRNWNSTADQGNRRRLDDPDDFVRIEIEAALERGIRVIPVLVDGATMPRREDLPESLQKLRRRQAIEISHNRFDSDVERLTYALSLIEEEIRQREAETERAAREDRERHEAEEARAEEARRLADVEAARQAEYERRAKETADGERAARLERETQDAAKAAEAQQAKPTSPAKMLGARTGLPPLLLVGVATFALLSAWILFGPPHGTRPAVESGVPGLQPREAAATPSGQPASPNPPLTPTPEKQGLAPIEENEMGDSYFYGNGVERDYAKAMEWYRKAADQGFADAQYNVGALYELGMGVARDIEQARASYQKAADNGDAFARSALERLQPQPKPFVQDAPSQPPTLTPEKQSLTPIEENKMGDGYFYGNGVERDYAKAMEWYRKAADQGFANAQYNVGALYELGMGVARDIEQARAWYQKAADNGDAFARGAVERLQPEPKPSAQDAPNPPTGTDKAAADKPAAGSDKMAAGNAATKELADKSAAGRVGADLTQDSADAEEVRGFKLAADQRDASAQVHLGISYEIGFGGLPKNEHEAARLFKLSADQGNAEGENRLGVFYEDGRGGLRKDDREAARLYKLAADQGNASGQINLGGFYESGRAACLRVTARPPASTGSPPARETHLPSSFSGSSIKMDAAACQRTTVSPSASSNSPPSRVIQLPGRVIYLRKTPWSCSSPTGLHLALSSAATRRHPRRRLRARGTAKFPAFPSEPAGQ